MEKEILGTHQKARRINTDSARHGTFAEIGAGQEVARWFFRVGGASSTVAKTISAYDMAVSDAIYGPSERYVSRARLRSMLEYEYELLLARLREKRGSSTTFFAFADSVAMGSLSRHEPGRGWVGVRFQHQPLAPYSEIMAHVRMFEPENVSKQEALGVFGVNLIYGCFYLRQDPPTLIQSLMDGLRRERIEIDMIRFMGPAFPGIDNRLMSLQLVEQGFTDAVMFDARGEVIQPAEVLFGKPVLVERGSFRPVTRVTLDLLEKASARFSERLEEGGAEPAVIMEMSLRNLLSGDRIDHRDFLARADILGELGKTVMITDYPYYYPLAEYLRLYTRGPIVFALGVPNLARLFDESYYAGLDGGILEALGRLFKSGIKLYVYPMRDPETGRVVRAGDLRVPSNLRHLYAHLMENGFIEPIEKFDELYLDIFPKKVLGMIQSGTSGWEAMVPPEGARLIRERKVFGYRAPDGSVTE